MNKHIFTKAAVKNFLLSLIGILLTLVVLTSCTLCASAAEITDTSYAFIKGDINSNQRVGSEDALAILRYATGQTDTIDMLRADMNSDGEINSVDALFILQTAVEKRDCVYIYGPYKVISVTDGDTFKALINGNQTKVRLIGVDTPESVATGNNAYKNCEEGIIASDFTKSCLTNQEIYIEYDIDPDDVYGRTLAYVYLTDGTMYNKLLLQKGYARMMTVEPNKKYVTDFNLIQAKAQKNQEGFWADYFLTH